LFKNKEGQRITIARKGEQMSKRKVIVGIIAAIIVSVLGGFLGGKLYAERKIKHITKHRMERFAEGRPHCGWNGPGMERFAAGGPSSCRFKHRAERFEKIINELDLTADQKKKVADIFAKDRAERKKLIDSLDKAQEQLHAAISAKKFNEAAFRQAFKQAASAKEELIVTRKKTGAELNAVLAPEQAGYLRGRMKTKNEFCKKNHPCLRGRGHHGPMGESDFQPQHHQEQSSQSSTECIR